MGIVLFKKETNIGDTILKSIEIFPNEDLTKHLILITDAVPTFGESPEKETLDAANKASAAGITMSIIGINLDENAKKLAEHIVAIGNGRLYAVKNLDNLDTVMLEEYNTI